MWKCTILIMMIMITISISILIIKAHPSYYIKTKDKVISQGACYNDNQFLCGGVLEV